MTTHGEEAGCCLAGWQAGGLAGWRAGLHPARNCRLQGAVTSFGSTVSSAQNTQQGTFRCGPRAPCDVHMLAIVLNPLQGTRLHV